MFPMSNHWEKMKKEKNHVLQAYIYFLVSEILCLLISMTFYDPPLEVHDLSGLENNIMEFHDFPSVPWPVQTQ